ncbi:DciA family protein [Corynebacterium pyruviciproducens]|nr:DciA family protein [Corynebacterium pyruviciproducens]MDK6566751.1 DciA family protein [Corynebacterium pyruviciproducens]
MPSDDFFVASFEKLQRMGHVGANPNPATGGHLRPRTTRFPTGKDGRRLFKPRKVENFNSILGREIKKQGWQKPLAAGWIMGQWPSVVGHDIAAHTKIEMVKGSTLFITCDSTAWATNLRLMQRRILQTIAEMIGPNIITQLKIFGPKPPSWRKGRLHVKGRGPRDTYG